MKDYYSLLGVDTKATKAEIKKNYRLLAAKFHPDKNPDPDASAKFIAITEAYDVLSNTKSRARYDLIRWQKLKQKNNPNDYNIVVPPTESLRSIRNKAQQKRSLKYHNTKNTTERQFQLVVESLYIFARYMFHILGIPLFIVILYSVLEQLSEAFEVGIGRGIGLAAFVVLLGYIIFKITQHFIQELKIDLNKFSAYYKISFNKAALSFLSVIIGLSILLIAIFQIF